MNQVNAQFGASSDKTPEQQIAELRAQLEAANKQLAKLTAGDDALEPQGTLDEQGFPPQYSWVTIFAGRDTQDLPYVPIGVRGYVLKVQRGVKVAIPDVFKHVLENAVEEVTVRAEGGLITRPAHRFAFSVHGPCSPAEYQEFRRTQVSAGNAASVKH